ncbi:hypothetical protein D915_008169 [Fasciola hepatica]|uniref:Uncharacterized protein n=1 Tax=Fasciola hepatica TaxID=6192 RepID=A0A2H1BZM0_FASHE|nr:hypothetical protein D915_008169 [Fasciola hepatica]
MKLSKAYDTYCLVVLILFLSFQSAIVPTHAEESVSTSVTSTAELAHTAAIEASTSRQQATTNSENLSTDHTSTSMGTAEQKVTSQPIQSITTTAGPKPFVSTVSENKKGHSDHLILETIPKQDDAATTEIASTTSGSGTSTEISSSEKKNASTIIVSELKKEMQKEVSQSIPEAQTKENIESQARGKIIKATADAVASVATQRNSKDGRQPSDSKGDVFVTTDKNTTSRKITQPVYFGSKFDDVFPNTIILTF